MVFITAWETKQKQKQPKQMAKGMAVVGQNAHLPATYLGFSGSLF